MSVVQQAHFQSTGGGSRAVREDEEVVRVDTAFLKDHASGLGNWAYRKYKERGRGYLSVDAKEVLRWGAARSVDPTAPLRLKYLLPRGEPAYNVFQTRDDFRSVIEAMVLAYDPEAEFLAVCFTSGDSALKGFYRLYRFRPDGFSPGAGGDLLPASFN
ncbi:hypothetical protein [Rubrivirga marina]|uniref:Uncharacterized protein n=1 Tax=Rubrivirga marina TaxID=1196024 RepID=A0A271J0J8_9BACT|nr:hypothetical protein [Rubrivirga marina]PAP76983.1 hypothetical protein BSZ37_11340 [Rubrivirga marina]